MSTVELHTGSPNAKILFTTDGSMPTSANGMLYEQPIHLDSQSPSVVVLRAREVLTEHAAWPGRQRLVRAGRQHSPAGAVAHH